MDEHLRSFAATPGEEAQKMFLAHVLRTGRRIDFRLASLDHALEIVHVKNPRCPKQYAGPWIRFSTLRSAKALPRSTDSRVVCSMHQCIRPPHESSVNMTVRLLLCALLALLHACVSPSREELPLDSPFIDQAELDQPSSPDGTAVGDVTSHSA